MKTNQLKSFIVLIISIILVIIGLVLYFPNVVSYGYPSFFLFSLGITLFFLSLFRILNNTALKKYSNTKAFSTISFAAFILYFAYTCIFMLIGEFDFGATFVNGFTVLDYIVKYYLNRFIISGLIILASLVSFVFLIVINLNVRKENDLYKRGIILDFVLGFPLGISILNTLMNSFRLMLFVFR